MTPIKDVVNAINGKEDLRYGISLTGGGSGAINELLRYGGASSNMLFANVPYHPTSWRDILTGMGMPPVLKKYNSIDAASILAEMAFRSVMALVNNSPHSVGVGATASLAKAAGQVEREGREHVAYITFRNCTIMSSFKVTFNSGTRVEQENLLSDVIIRLLAEFTNADLALEDPRIPAYAGACDIVPLELFSINPSLDKALRTGVLNQSTFIGVPQGDDKLNADITCKRRPIRLILPGSFNPPHEAHREMMQIAEELTGLRGWYELSITNVDKGRLSPYELQRRIAGLNLFSNKVLITQSPRMLDKLTRFPNAVLVVGADTWVRMWDEKQPDRRELYNLLYRTNGPSCVVFSRKVDGKLHDPRPTIATGMFSALNNPTQTIFVPPEVYCSEVSSTQLRGQDRGR